MSDISLPDDVQPRRVYNADDVDAYVQDLLAELATLQRELTDLRSRAGTAVAVAPPNLEETERLVGRVMMQAHRAAQETEAEARAKAQAIIQRADREANAISPRARPSDDDRLPPPVGSPESDVPPSRG